LLIALVAPAGGWFKVDTNSKAVLGPPGQASPRTYCAQNFDTTFFFSSVHCMVRFDAVP